MWWVGGDDGWTVFVTFIISLQVVKPSLQFQSLPMCHSQEGHHIDVCQRKHVSGKEWSLPQHQQDDKENTSSIVSLQLNHQTDYDICSYIRTVPRLSAIHSMMYLLVVNSVCESTRSILMSAYLIIRSSPVEDIGNEKNGCSVTKKMWG